ncbi:MAG: hypothetical protein JKY33_04475 [Bacteroidia bacterium]|nr:hypothetical protein [Bacteroidia bacterium]
MRMTTGFLYLLSALIVTSCFTAKNKTTENNISSTNKSKNEKSKQNANSTEKIVFITFLHTKEEDGSEAISIANQKVRDGKLKTPNQLEYQLEEDHLLCTFYDSKHQVLFTRVIPHPLEYSLEYSSEEGKFETTMIKRKEADFTIRIQYDNKIKTIGFEKIDSELTLNKIIEIPITF